MSPRTPVTVTALHYAIASASGFLDMPYNSVSRLAMQAFLPVRARPDLRFSGPVVQRGNAAAAPLSAPLRALLPAARGGGTAAVRSTSISSFTAGGSGGSPYRTANT